MKLSLNWLNDYIDIGHDAEAIAETLSDLGFPCEGIESLAHDIVLDAEVTSNRGDCLGYIGFARELSVATGKPLKMPEVVLTESDTETATQVQVEIEEPDLCRRYSARVIGGVKVGPTPDWMKQRLEAVGLRSVNNVVDATNYALMETGQPPHAFDLATLRGGKIVVRRARAGETLISINETECKLTPEMLIIADGEGPVAIAGVMGGLATEVSDATTDILLEEAFFDPVAVRSTSRALALPSDASYRFERIVNIESIDWASQRTAQLIVAVAGGTVSRGSVDAYPRPAQTRSVSLRVARLQQVLGITVPEEDVHRILSALQCQPQREGDRLNCTVPSWRSDISREVDLIEEVARCYGYDKIPMQQRIAIDVCPVDQREKRLLAIGRQLQACGYYETIGVDFVEAAQSQLFGGVGDRALAVKDNTRKEANQLRQSLLGTLLGVLKTNANAKTLPCRVYEVANTFVPAESDGLPQEHSMMALVADSDFRQLRASVEQAIGAVVKDAQVAFASGTCTWAQACAEIRVNGIAVGQAGVFNETVLKSMEIKNLEPVGAQVDLDRLIAIPGGDVTVRPIPRFPAIERDLSIVVPENVLWAEILDTIHTVAPDELEDARFVEIYRGKGIPQASKSLTLSLCFRDADGTLKHEDVDAYQDKIVKMLAEKNNAAIRTV